MFHITSVWSLVAATTALAAIVLLLPAATVECAYDMSAHSAAHRNALLSPALRAVFADAEANTDDNDNDAGDGDYYSDEQEQEFLDNAVAAKRVKPSLSITNSLDVLRQQVMLDFVRKQMRENMRKVESNRDHLKTVGKRGESVMDAMLGRPHSRASAHKSSAASGNTLVRSVSLPSLSNYQQQQRQLQQQQQQQQQQKRLRDASFVSALE